MPSRTAMIKPRVVRRTGLVLAVTAAMWSTTAFVASHVGPNSVARQAISQSARLTSMRAGVTDQVTNTVKTVADTVNDFWRVYPQPPLLPMFRPFIIDTLQNAHIAVVNPDFKYDAVWAYGLREYFFGLMTTYDKMVNAGETDKIWASFIGALELDVATVNADHEAIASYGKSKSPAEILADVGGSSDSKFAAGVKSLKGSYHSTPFSVGLFKVMEAAGVDVNKANAEEWTKAMELPTSKITRDLETYLAGQEKMKGAMEMVREVEIREKKNLAEKLEAKAKALAAKAAEKAAEAKKA